MIRATTGPKGPSRPSEIHVGRARIHVEMMAREMDPHTTAQTASRITRSADELDVIHPAKIGVATAITGRVVPVRDRSLGRQPSGPPAYRLVPS